MGGRICEPEARCGYRTTTHPASVAGRNPESPKFHHDGGDHGTVRQFAANLFDRHRCCLQLRRHARHHDVQSAAQPCLPHGACNRSSLPPRLSGSARTPSAKLIPSIASFVVIVPMAGFSRSRVAQPLAYNYYITLIYCINTPYKHVQAHYPFKIFFRKR